MPTYDYECLEGHRFDVVQKMSDEPVRECPECGQPAERKISGGVGFLFKGEGFYITDSRSEEYKKKASADSGESSSKSAEKSGSSSGSGSESTASSSSGSSASGSSESGSSASGSSESGSSSSGSSSSSTSSSDD